jgi:cadmium resistance protein CadD (predicted permease)
MITSILAFISTNIDDIFILTLFFGSKKFSKTTIVSGQFLGIGVLVIISLIGAYIGNFIGPRYIGLLGLFPIYLAVRQLITLFRSSHDDENVDVKASGILAIAGVTIANGGDNIGVYVPLLATMSLNDKLQLVIIFIIMTYTWCLLASYLAGHPLVAKQLDKYGHVIMPVVLFCLGIFILIESDSFSLFLK